MSAAAFPSLGSGRSLGGADLRASRRSRASRTGLGTWDLILRKLAHLTEYAILGALLARALARPELAIAIGALYATSDEIHQHFVRGRHAAWYDVLIDTIGVSVGVLAWSRSRVAADERGPDRPGRRDR